MSDDRCECSLRHDHGLADACPESQGRLACTRPKGHDGPHSACTTSEHPADTWEGSDDAE